ncbi:ABC transporter substrate-binding protein [Paenactinomyces guangxiensis]|uniref:ABC transporter substrate-binding protein n=1 Tax=Paenactinomyces guangxiensis TaxID=1490290 RepID=A0A7W1WPJ8_9BACL|nr:ABC transporter substrate-binding protein [Paenactinomyces guangxiensis]MBA4493690.1 ABC transporter substrate-binding protein [Paenactinomyces guangxiensis]MBH8590977.1 ABC transporter substrate-binding protein [Paenactinomyces guangxiensis]
MKKKVWIITLALLFVLSSILAGCSGNKPSSAKSKTLIFGRGADSKLLDPAQVTDGESLHVTEQIFETLVKYDKKTTEVQPHLAESWETSPDGLVWTFKLKQGVKFHDGTPFNAEAVVYNFNRWMDKSHPEHKGGEFPYYGYMFGGYKGDKGHVIKSVTAVDEHTVKFELNFPQGPFLSNLAMPPFAIASPAAVKKGPDQFAQKPEGGGTGPFKFVEWKKNDSITLEKNKEYWEKGLPKLDKVIFRSIPDNAARFTALQSGDIDMMDGLNPNDVQLIKGNNKLKLYEQPGMNVAYLAFNTQKKPFDNPKVRQALNHATNKEGIIKSFYAGMAVPAVNPMPDIMWGYNKNIKDYEYNLEKAKQLLAEAGYPNGFEVEFYAMTEPRPYMPDGKKVAEYMAEDFAKIGVKTKIVTYDWQTYLDRTGKGEHSMALMGWNGDNGDPDNFLYVLLDKDNTRTPDAGNIAFYKSDELHDVLIKAQRATKQEERTQLYMKAQEIIKRDAPWVPLVHATAPLASKAEVTGFVPHPTSNVDLREVDIK